MSNDLGRWRRIYATDWQSVAVLNFADGERVTWAYCKTGPQSTSVGCYRLSTAVAVEELGNIVADEFERRLDTVCRALGWRFDPIVRVLWMPEWIEQNPPQSANVVTSWRKLLENVPDCAVKCEAVAAIHRYLKDSPTIKNHQAYLDAFGDLPQRLRALFRNSQAQPQAQPGSHQGAVIQGFRERGDQDDAARRKQPRELNALAQQAITIAKNEPIENQLEEFDRLARASNVHDYTESAKRRAIERALQRLTRGAAAS